MKVTVFRSLQGDCLLVEGRRGTTLLADGGMVSSYNRHVAPALAKRASQGKALQVVYVSHIDQDHIAGILRMLDDEVAWRVYDYQKSKRKKNDPRLGVFKPENPRPPEIKELWHNAFHDEVGENRGRLEDFVLALMKTTLLDRDLRSCFLELDNLISSERQALLLQHRLSRSQLDIPVNRPAKRKLMFIGKGGTVSKPIRRRELRFTVIGPRREALDRLREEWNEWVEKNQKTITRIREQARLEADRIHADEAVSFRSVLSRLAAELGDRRSVTPPNLASLMLLVQEGKKTLLLTGDSHSEDIRAGLREAKLVKDDERIHFDAIKVQHHGSEHNLDEEFCRKVTAGDYIFCGDGSHENPDLRVVELLIRERLALADELGPFKLWFNSSKRIAPEGERQKHMQKLESLVQRHAGKHPDRLQAHFLKQGSSFEIDL